MLRNLFSLRSVPWDDNAVGYSYLANSPLLEHTYFTNAGALRMTTTRQFDLVNRLKQIGTVLASAAVINSFAYGYNPADQRTAITNADQSRWAYAYDRLGQVTNGVRYWSDNTPVAGQQFAYGFDQIGNRKRGGLRRQRMGQARCYTQPSIVALMVNKMANDL